MSTFDFTSAFREAVSQEFSNVPDEAEIALDFSSDFLQKTENLVASSNGKSRKSAQTFAKRIACVAAIVALLTSAAIAIAPLRQSVMEFFVEFHHRFSVITFHESTTGDTPNSQFSMQRYTLCALPDGFVEDEFQDFPLFYWTVYVNQDGDSIILQQGNGQEEITLDHEFSDTSFLQSPQGTDVLCCAAEGSITLIWTQDCYSFSITCSGNFTVQQVLSLVDQIILKKS